MCTGSSLLAACPQATTSMRGRGKRHWLTSSGLSAWRRTRAPWGETRTTDARRPRFTKENPLSVRRLVEAGERLLGRGREKGRRMKRQTLALVACGALLVASTIVEAAGYIDTAAKFLTAVPTPTSPWPATCTPYEPPVMSHSDAPYRVETPSTPAAISGCGGAAVPASQR